MMTGSRRRTWMLVTPVFAALLLGLLAGTGAAAVPEASDVSSTLQSAAATLSWVRCGGPLGGIGYDIRMRPDNPDIMLVTDNFAGVFRSTDGGATWQPSNNGINVRTGTSGDAIPVFCLTIDPNDNDIVWAGTTNIRGVFRSVDGGLTWTERSNGVVEAEGITFRGFTVDPRSSDIVYAAAELSSWQWNGGVEKKGRVFDLTKGVVYKTTDGGANWKAVWRGENLARYVWIDRVHPDTVYVSTGIFDREAANSDPTVNGPTGGEGVIKSTDGGLTWTRVNNGLGKNLYVGSLFMRPDNPQVLLAGIGLDLYHDQDHGGVYLSTNGGASWRRTLDTEVVTSVEFCVSNPQIAYAASFGHVFRSKDGGQSWNVVTSPGVWGWGPPGAKAGFPIDLQVDPRDPDRLLANSYLGGNFLSLDGGATWSTSSKGYTGAQSRNIAVDPLESGGVIAVGRSGIFKSLNGGMDWTGLGVPPADYVEWNAVAIDPENGQHILAAQNQFDQVAESKDGGRSWALRETALGDRLAFRSIVFAPSDARTVYAGTGAFYSAGTFSDELSGKGLHISRDGGRTWAAANDATSASVQVADIAVQPQDPETVCVAALGNGLLKTTNGGKSWARITGAWPTNVAVRAVAFNPTNPQTIFAATDAGMFRTADGGATWQQLASGIPPEARPTSIAVDPTNPQILYVSDLRSGVYRTENGGNLWVPVNQGLRNRAANRLALSSDGNHLYAATEGEGVFRLDLNGAPPPEVTEPVRFSDVSSFHPYYSQITDVAGKGIVSGYADGTFGPDRLVTRQQFAKMIVKAQGLAVTGSEQCPFTDVAHNLDANDPFYPDKYVAVCAAHGITTGKTPTTFNPTGNMTRAQLITMVARAANLPEPPVEYVPPFSDFSSDHYPWARKAAYAGLLEGLQGMGSGYDFLKSATRGEVCVLLYSLLQR